MFNDCGVFVVVALMILWFLGIPACGDYLWA